MLQILIKIKCAFVNLGGDVFLNGLTFQPKPRDGITIAVWIKLDTIVGTQSIFDTVGTLSKSNHTDGQFHFEVEDGKVRWFHRNEIHVTIFDVKSRDIVVQPEQWVHVVGTYDANKRIAKVIPLFSYYCFSSRNVSK